MKHLLVIAGLMLAAPAASAGESSFWGALSDDASALGDAAIDVWDDIETPASVSRALDQAGEDADALGDAIIDLAGPGDGGATGRRGAAAIAPPPPPPPTPRPTPHATRD
ncbi:MAG: hypothetical protein AAF360_19295 [Pseudomonadota bacterium]